MSELETEVMEGASNKGLLRPKEKPMEYPGHIAFADVRGNYPGCAAVLFRPGLDVMTNEVVDAAQAMNLFFQRNKGLLVVHVQSTMDWLLVLYTKVVPPEELERMERFHTLVREQMEREDMARAEYEDKAAEAAEAQTKEHARLVELGRKCEANHGKGKQS